MTAWKRLQEILIDETSASWSDRELEYLEYAFTTCEQLWENQVSRVTSPKLVLIGEAPRFGAEERYIYSPNVRQSTFMLASNFPGDPVPKNFSQLKKKKILLDRVAKHGVIIIDAFPYALNAISTPTMYFQKGENKMRPRVYERLLKRVFQEYTAVKLNKVLSKADDTKIAVRYSRTYDAITQVLLAENLEPPFNLGKQGGGIDKEAFRNLL